MKSRIESIYAGCGFIRMLIDQNKINSDDRWKKSLLRLIEYLQDEFDDKPETIESAATFEQAQEIFK